MNRERMQDMNDYEVGRYGTHSGGGMSPFLMGAITGAAVALLFAPKPGSETRHWVADKARKLRHRGEEELDRMGMGDGEGGSRAHSESRGAGTSGSYGSAGAPGAQGGPGAGPGTGGGPKGPTSTNPVPTSPTGSTRV